MSDQEQQEQQGFPVFTDVEARILASLMEKEQATPDNYPLTINSLTLACNQKSNREPVMSLTQGEVGHTVNELADRELVHIDYGERAHRISHRMRSAFGLNRKQQAILTVLILRRPSTLNEIRTRTERLAEFDGVEEILLVIEELIGRGTPLLVCLPKGPGQREDRYAHTLCGPVEYTPTTREVPPLPELDAEREGRFEALERRIELLEGEVQRLRERLGED